MSLIAAGLLMLAAETGQRTINYWMVYDGREIDRESIVFVEKSALVQRPDGWINFSFQEVRNGSRLKTVKSRSMGTWVNCKTREFINDYRTEYGKDGAMLQQGKLDEQRRIPAPGSAEEKVLAFACGDTRGATQLPQGADIYAYADNLYAQGHPQVARAPATPAAPPARTPTTGQTADYWLVYPMSVDNLAAAVAGDDRFDEIIAFVERSSIVRKPDGWIAFDYVYVRNGSKAKDFKWNLMSTRVNCKTRQYVDELGRALTKNGTLYGEAKGTGAVNIVESDSILERVFKFACGDTAEATQLPRGAEPVAYADNLYASGREATAAAPASKPRTVAATPPPRTGGTAAPRRGRPEFWFVAATNDNRMVFFIDKASISRKTGGKAEFWREVVDGTKDEPIVEKQRTEIDCAHRTLRGIEAFNYDGAGKLIGAVRPEPEYAIRDSAISGRIFAFVCQGKEDFASKLDPELDTLTFFLINLDFSND